MMPSGFFVAILAVAVTVTFNLIGYQSWMAWALKSVVVLAISIPTVIFLKRFAWPISVLRIFAISTAIFVIGVLMFSYFQGHKKWGDSLLASSDSVSGFESRKIVLKEQSEDLSLIHI